MGALRAHHIIREQAVRSRMPDILRVLLVEDDDVDRLAVHRAVKRGDQPAELVDADSMSAAVAAIQIQAPDCILVDYNLPDGTAAELLSKLEVIGNQAPVIILTGFDDEETALEALKLGAQDYLLKSQLDSRSLWRAIRYAVQRQEVQRLQHRLVHTDRLSAIGQLAAGVAHEINNPACYILANLGFIRESLDDLRDKIESSGTDPKQIEALVAGALSDALAEADEAIADSIHGTERICKIVRELRPFSRIERGELEPVDLNQVVESAINLTGNEIRHRAELVRELTELPRVVGDRAKLCQVAVNLITNATQSIEAGAADKNTITITTDVDGDQVVLRVSDTGSGIPENVRKRMFEPFFTTKEREVGTGLGLAICAETIRKHGGAIEVESSVGQGTTFTVRIPRNTGLVESARVDSLPSIRPTDLDKAQILLIDDDRLVRTGLRRLLAPPHNVTEAASGASALELLKESSFDVIICDLMMPEVDGPAVYDQLSSSQPELLDRIVFLTGGAFTPAGARLRDQRGCDGAGETSQPSEPSRDCRPFVQPTSERLITDRRRLSVHISVRSLYYV